MSDWSDAEPREAKWLTCGRDCDHCRRLLLLDGTEMWCCDGLDRDVYEVDHEQSAADCWGFEQRGNK